MWISLLSTALAGSLTLQSGDRPIADVLTAIQAHRATVEPCFETSPGPGKLILTVEADGSVSDTKFSTANGADPQMLQCLMRESLRFRMPARASASTFQWMASKEGLDEKPEAVAPQAGEMVVSGAITLEEMRSMMDRNEANFKTCTRKATQMKEAVPPFVDLAFTVSEQGKVASVTYTGEVSSLIQDCLSAQLKLFTYPKPQAPGTTDVRWRMRMP